MPIPASVSQVGQELVAILQHVPTRAVNTVHARTTQRASVMMGTLVETVHKSLQLTATQQLLYWMEQVASSQTTKQTMIIPHNHTNPILHAHGLSTVLLATSSVLCWITTNLGFQLITFKCMMPTTIWLLYGVLMDILLTQ
jgi:hypothetical protein